MTTALAVISLAALSFGHLAPSYDASLRMGRTGGAPAMGGKGLRAETRAAYSNKGEWKETESYNGSYMLRQGDTVSYGEWNGKKLWWWAKFAAEGTDKPGTIKEGGTSAWILINSLSASSSGTPNYVWKGWNGDIANKPAGLWAEVPTWRDGAEGAYSFTHDDIGAMPFDLSIKPGWELAQEQGFEDIKQSWGVYVDAMVQENSWDLARQMVMQGHEMFNHSMDHTSAANRRYLFFPNDMVPEGDQDIPQELRGLQVVGAWKIMSHHVNNGWGTFAGGKWNNNVWVDWSKNQKTGDQNGDWQGPLTGSCYWENKATKSTTYIDTVKAENDLITIFAYPDWNGNSPADKCGENGIFRIEPKSGTETITLPTGQKMYLNKATKKVSVNVAGWYESKDIKDRFSFYESATSSTGGSDGLGDKGRYGFMLNIFAANGWNAAEKERNVVESNNIMNNNIYSQIGATPYFKTGKRSEYFGYPFDVYSEETHNYLESKGFTAARGGAKSGVPMPGDFFHPYRIDFDAFFIELPNWDETKGGYGDANSPWVAPNNAHVLLGLNEMVEQIIAKKGYMIREFHAVAAIDGGAWNTGSDNEKWEVNDASKPYGGWWGGITKSQLRAHYNFVKTQIDAKKITVYTVSEAVKYRMTANAVNGTTINPDGNNYKLTVNVGDIPGKYKDEITVIVSLNNSIPEGQILAVEYANDGGEGQYGIAPRRMPKRMDNAGKIWSVSVNPYRGTATLIPNGEWKGVTESQVTSIDKNVSNRAIKQNTISFVGIQHGKIALNLTKGQYTAELYNLQGRLIGRTDFTAVNGVNATNLRTDNLAKGMFILNVKQAGKLVLNNKIMVK